MKGIQDFKVSVLKKGIHYVTSDYKTRNSSRTHSGIDIVSYNGNNTTTDDIIAPNNGIVVSVKKEKEGGNIVEIKHPSGIISRYVHLKNNSIYVKKGDNVVKGQVLAKMGNTGTNSTGAHLHFGIIKNNKTVDPLPYLNDESLYNDNNQNFSLGKYQLLEEKYIRRTPSLGNNIISAKGCTTATKKVLVSLKGKAKIKKGSIITISKIIEEKEKRIFGKYGNCYVCLRNKDGYMNAKKI